MTYSIGTDIDYAARCLQQGRLVAFATETVYGLGANALDAQAVARIFAAKNRPRFDPLIVHIADRSWLPRLVTSWPARAGELANRFWPGPLTLVVPKTDLIPDLVTSGLPTVGIRMPDHPQALRLLTRADMPVAAPSANPFGRVSPTCAQHVADSLGDRVDYILDGGRCAVGIESTVLQIVDDRVVLLRHGGVSLERIESAIGPVDTPTRVTTHPEEAAPAPGMAPQHYAPRTPLMVVTAWSDVTGAPEERLGVITLAPPPVPHRFAAIEVLSSRGDLTEAAANLFAAMRRLDALSLDRIVAVAVPNHALGRAINDRLTRAASRP